MKTITEADGASHRSASRTRWFPPSRRSATKNPRPFNAKRFRCCSRAATCSARPATGTGKTAAFALPLLDRLLRDPTTNRGRARALVLVPTRELAMQVAEALHKYAKGSNLNVVPVYGGAPMDHQIRALRRGAEVVVGTPGRVLDHICAARRSTSSTVEVLVLDEADEMLDMGFAEDIDADPRRDAGNAADRALRGDAGASHRSHRGPAPRRPEARHHRQRESSAPARCRSSARSPTSWDAPQKMTALARILDFEGPEVGDRLLPHAHRGRRAHRHAQRARLRRAGAARRHGAEAARSRHAAVPQRAGRHPRGDRRGRARPRHRSRVARHQLRPADGARSLRAPHRPHRPDRPRGRWRSRWPTRASTASSSSSRRSPSRRSRSSTCRPKPT